MSLGPGAVGRRLVAAICMAVLGGCPPDPIDINLFGSEPSADVGTDTGGKPDAAPDDLGNRDVAPELNPWNPACTVDADCEAPADATCQRAACVANACVTSPRLGAKTWGGGLEDRWSAVLPLEGGDALLVGNTASTGAGRLDGWYARVTASGEARWQRTFGTAANEVVADAALIDADGFVVGGGTGTTGFVARYSFDGTLSWQWEGGASIAAVAVHDNQVYAAGWTGVDGITVWRLDAAGEPLSEDTGLGTGRPRAIAVTSADSYTLAGWTGSANARAAWVAGVASGAVAWTAEAALAGGAEATALVAGLDDDLVAVGTTTAGAGWIASLGSTGELNWRLPIVQPLPSSPRTVAVTGDYGYAVGGASGATGFMAQYTRLGAFMWSTATPARIDAVATLDAPLKVVGVGSDLAIAKGDAAWQALDAWGSDQCSADSVCATLLPGACDLTNPCETVICDAADGCDALVLECDDANPCTSDSCEPGTGCVFDPIPLADSPCDDGDACTFNDACDSDGACLGQLVDCDDGEVCTADSCDSLTGCANDGAELEGAACDDGTVCTDNDACSGGSCVGSEILCPAGSGDCEVASCDPVAGCQITAAANGVLCDDGNLCSQGDQCLEGACVGSPFLCDGGDGCSGTVCEPTTGNCVPGTAEDGTPCNDGDACQVGETCQAGACAAGGVFISCDDGNPCTTDSCDPATGCVNAPVDDGTVCDDGDACTSGDVCTAGTCGGGPPTVCDDGDSCTTDSCDPASGGCTFEAIPDGGACQTGDACTTGTCSAGTCDEVPLVCPDDGNPCTTAGACVAGVGCVWEDLTDGSSCDDGIACTLPGTCTAGVCTGQDPVVCSTTGGCDDSFCDEATGQCVAGTAPDGTVCDDGDGCTTGETCQTGSCEGGSPLSCDDGNACTIDGVCSGGVCPMPTPLNCVDGDPCTADQACDPQVGCVYGDATGTACDDGDACTDNDVCQGQTCQSGAAVNCDDGNACTEDLACDTVAGCQYNPLTTACDDGDECTENDTCDGAGNCVGSGLDCDDGNDCTIDSCTLASGCEYTDAADGASCEDGEVCTVGDTCNDSGVCQSGAVDTCDDGDACTDDSCVNGVGCDNAANTGNPCQDGDACTAGDSCVAGTCVGGGATVCDDGDVCTDDFCESVAGCATTNNTAACEDGDACTTGDGCVDGSCVAGGATVCDDGNPCTDDGCDPGTGCTVTNNTDACDDGDACTLGDACSGGSCQAGGGSPNCDDGNVCTDDLGCDAVAGCQYSDNTAACDDGEACTVGDVCSGGSCQAGSGSPSCDDSDPCTIDTCQVGVGCVNTSDTGSCDDGDACTTGETCATGTCEGGTATDCDDGNACTDDGCDSGSGCTTTDNTASCDDGSSCTINDVCSGGTCAGTVDCDDGNPCTADACVSDACENDPVTTGTSCNDGDTCTTGDVCNALGACAGTPYSCDDSNPCTTDVCNGSGGCFNFPGGSGPCDDGDACTGNDRCKSGGVCEGIQGIGGLDYVPSDPADTAVTIMTGGTRAAGGSGTKAQWVFGGTAYDGDGTSAYLAGMSTGGSLTFEQTYSQFRSVTHVSTLPGSDWCVIGDDTHFMQVLGDSGLPQFGICEAGDCGSVDRTTRFLGTQGQSGACLVAGKTGTSPGQAWLGTYSGASFSSQFTIPTTEDSALHDIFAFDANTLMLAGRKGTTPWMLLYTGAIIWEQTPTLVGGSGTPHAFYEIHYDAATQQILALARSEDGEHWWMAKFNLFTGAVVWQRPFEGIQWRNGTAGRAIHRSTYTQTLLTLTGNRSGSDDLYLWRAGTDGNHYWDRDAFMDTLVLAAAPAYAGNETVPSVVGLWDVDFGSGSYTGADNTDAGRTVATSGTTGIGGNPVAIIGITEADNGAGGAAIYRYDGGSPEVQELVIPSPTANARVGFGVDIEGTVAVAGGGGLGFVATAGSVHVFEDSGSGYTHVAELVGSTTANQDRLGNSVGITDSQQTILAGAPGHDGTLGSNSGQVYAFDKVAGTWTEVQAWQPPSGPLTSFGHAVAVDGEHAVVGAPPSFGGGGRAFAYVRGNVSNNDWTQVGELMHPSGSPQGFGDNVAIHGELVAVAQKSGNPVHVYRRRVINAVSKAFSYEHVGELVAPISSLFYGRALAVHGPMVVVGDGGGNVFLFEQRGAAFAFLDSVTGSGLFGTSAALRGDHLLIGAPDVDDVYERRLSLTGAVLPLNQWGRLGTASCPSDGGCQSTAQTSCFNSNACLSSDCEAGSCESLPGDIEGEPCNPGPSGANTCNASNQCL